jgi:hypothetical protein
VSHRPVLTGRALAQYNDFIKDHDHPDAYEAFMRRLLWLVDAPWDAWPVYPGGHEPEFGESQFGEHGLISFRVDDAELLVIFNILWAG